MALLKCRECGAGISSDAFQCRRCGCEHPFKCDECGREIGMIKKKSVPLTDVTEGSGPDLGYGFLTTGPTVRVLCDRCVPYHCPFCGTVTTGFLTKLPPDMRGKEPPKSLVCWFGCQSCFDRIKPTEVPPSPPGSGGGCILPVLTILATAVVLFCR